MLHLTILEVTAMNSWYLLSCDGIDLYRTCTDHNAACKNLGKEPEEE